MKSTPSRRFPLSNKSKRLFLLTLISLVAVAALLSIAASANKANRTAKARAELAANTKSAINPTVQNDKLPNAPAAAVIVATLTDNTAAATKVAPGGVINYTATVTNNGAASPADDATNLNFSAPLDANTTLVGGSVHASPLAFNDTYNWVGNTQLDTVARVLPAVTANDVAVNAPGGTDTFTLTAIGGGATALGGVVTLASPAGSFVYTPPVGRPNIGDGATVQDSFTYTITNSADPTLTATGTVRINLTGRVWYLVAGGVGDGRSNTPSGSPSAMSTAADKGTDIFYIFSNAGSLNGPFSLDAGQQLLGQGVNLVVSAITLFIAAAPTPTTTNTAGNCVALAGAPGNNTLSGFNIGNCTGGTAITGANVGTLNVSTVSINTNGGGLDLTGSGLPTVSVVLGGLTSTAGTKNVNLVGLNGTITLAGGALSGSTAGATNHAFAVSGGGTAGITYSGSITKANTGNVVNISGRTGGTITLSGTINGSSSNGINVSSNTGGTVDFSGGTKTLNTAANAALTLNTNTGATINFSGGGLDIDTTSGAGFTATGGGIVNVTGSGNTIASVNATALNVANTTIGASDLNFQSISSGNNDAGADPANGIVLSATGSSGGLTVTGNGGTCSSVANCTGGAIQNTTGDGIVATNTQDLSLTRMIIQSAAGHGINGTDLRGTSLLSTSAIKEYDVNRTATKDGYKIVNNNNNLTLLTITGTTFDGTTSDAVNPGSGDGVFLEAQGTSNMTLSVEGNCVFTEMFDDAVQANTTTGANGTVNVTVKNSSFTNASVLGNGGVGLFPFGGPATFNATIDSNTFDTLMRPITNLGAISMTNGDLDGGGPTANFTISNNTINNIIGSRGITITADTFSGPTALTIDNNNIDRLGSNHSAINMNFINNVVNANVKVINNDIGQAAPLWTTGPTLNNAVLIQTQTSASANVLISNNIISANTSNVFEVVRTRAINTTTMNTTVTNNTVTDTDTTHTEIDASTANTATQCFNVSGNTVPAGGVGRIQLNEGAGTALNVTQASSAAVSAANNGATVAVTNTPQFGQPACTQPPIPPPADEGVFNITGNSENNLAFPNTAYQLPLAMFTEVMPEVAGVTEVAANTPSVSANVETIHVAAMVAAPAVTSYRAAIGNVMHQALNTMARVAQKFDSIITPTVYAQESTPNAPTAGENVTLNTIATFPAAGKSITIKYSATVNTTALTARQASTQGTVSGGNFASVLTDDPDVGGVQATITLLDTTLTWTGDTSTDWNDAANWDRPVAVQSSYAPGVSNPAVNDVVIPNVGAQPTISATDIGIYSLNLSNGRTLTITNPRVLTIGGSPGGDLTLDGIISGGFLNLGTGAHAINNAGGTGSLSSTNVATVLSGGIVTLNNNLQAGALGVNAGGSMNITNRTLSLNGTGGLIVPGGATFTTTGSTVVFNGTAAQQAAGIAYNNLTINNTAAGAPNALGATLAGNATVNGVLALTSNDLNTGGFTLTQPNTTASTGAGDVVGTVTRSGGPFGLISLTFGNPNNVITFTGAGTRPTTMTVVLAKTAPATYAAAVQRNYTMSQTGGSLFTATVRLHYLDTELNGNTPEANLGLRRFRAADSHWVAAPPPPGVPTRDGAANWIEATGVLAADLATQWTFSTLVPTASGGSVTGRIVDDNGNPVEGAVVRLQGTQNRKFITDANGFYRFDNVETNGFYTVTPSRANYSFTPSVRSFSQIGESTEAAFGATLSTSTLANPLDTPEYFVRQHYVDFLNREPDEAGFNFWSDQIIECSSDQNCFERRRENVSAAFFLSIEFQRTGGLVDGVYRAAYGARPDFAHFLPDTRTVGLGVQVGKEGWEALLATNTEAFVNSFVNRAEFHAAYDNLSNADYVDTLISHTGVSFTSAERDELLSGLGAGSMTRAQALRSIAENRGFASAKFNETFVMMEYFGYLRRDADASGFAFWLNKLSEFDGNFERAEMVKAFIVSGEYRDRFPR